MNRSGHQADHRALTVVMIDSHAAVKRGGAVQCVSWPGLWRCGGTGKLV
jgi:hypothetical protein